MRGDFSAWNKDRSQNFRGTLHQQGRVLLDRDWNAQTEIIGEWQERAGRDAFGPGVAAVPAERPNSFKVTKVEKFTTPAVRIDVSVNNGRVWADGLLVESFANMVRTATYLNPPPVSAADIPAPGKRDAVILETWLEELSPFQVPDLLLEPALGGVDTTERVQTAYRFRLFRMADGDTCDSIDLKDVFDKGTLTATLNPTLSTGGDCPVVESGGYTGFEHRLYRVEIAETDRTAPQAWFKWSQFNGGLVGRGFFDSASRKVIINANENAIVHSGISEFYLEALEFDVKLGHWRVIYGAKAVLASDHTLTLPSVANEPADKFIGSIPPSPPPGAPKKFYFFRLWNGIERVASFASSPTDLPDLVGIKLEFFPEGPGKYQPSDFWTFPVRVGENPPVLVNTRPPEGIYYHRVPLAEVHWDVSPSQKIEDCRQIFQPLTKQKTCCTYRVGDGTSSHGDFTSIQKAIDALPAKGGEVCVLPGEYEENVIIRERRHNVILRGCGKRTHIRGLNSTPVITVQSSQSIVIESLAIEGLAGALGIYLNGEEQAAGDARSDFYLKDIKLSDLTVFATGNSAVRAQNAQFLTLENSEIYIHDQLSYDPGVFLTGDDMVVERSEIRVLPSGTPTPNHAAGNVTRGRAFSNDPGLLSTMQGAPGGVRIGGGSDRVRIVDNLIISGTGHGISLGSVKAVPGTPPDAIEKKILQAVAKGWVNRDELPGIQLSTGQPLKDVTIESNHIINMGRNGISVFTFFSFPGQTNPNTGVQKLTSTDVPSLIQVIGLTIVGNRIESCVVNDVDIPDHMLSWMAWGGIVLADAEELTIRDNFLTGNGGSDFSKPICGIYVIQTEGLEISRNQIMGSMPTAFNFTVNVDKLGVRGGIWVHMAKTFIWKSIRLPGPAGNFSFRYQSMKGAAAKIQENIVTVIFGRSLTLGVDTGHVSVVGNNFTTFNPPPESPVEAFKLLRDTNFNLTPKLAFRLTDALAGNVIIFDRESLVHSLELLSAQLYPSFSYRVDRRWRYFGTYSNVAVIVPPPREAFEPSFTDTDFLFADNQCYQEWRNAGDETAANSVTAILIATSHDVGFTSNKSACMLQKLDAPGGGVLDFPVINTYIFAGRSSRTGDNRFIETDDLIIHPQPQQPLPRFPLAALTAANWNITTDNIGTHCIRVEGGTIPKYGRGLLPLYLSRHNLIELEELRGDIANIEPQARPCQRPVTFTYPTHVGTAQQAIVALEDYQAFHMGGEFQLQAAKTENYTLRYERNALRYGTDDPRTVEVGILRDASAAQSLTNFRVYDAASTAIIEIENGWTVDGYVRMPDGSAPAPIVTVAAYDRTGNWIRELSFGCTNVTGYFSIVVDKLTDRTPTPVYMRVSKNQKLLAAFNVPQLDPRSGGSDRIDIKLCDPNDRDCGPPDDRTMPMPPDKPPEPVVDEPVMGPGGAGAVGTSTGEDRTRGAGTVVRAAEKDADKETAAAGTVEKAAGKVAEKTKVEPITKAEEKPKAKAASGSKKTVPKKRGK